MASTQSPAQSSLALSQLIEQIINTKVDAVDFDLDKLIASIEILLAQYNAKLGKSCMSVLDGLPSASDAAVFSEGVAKNINIIATQISEYSGDKHSTAISVLKAAGNVHWAGLCLLLVAAVLQRVDTIKNNQKECLDLLSSMNDLAKIVRKLKEIPRAKDKMQTQIKESIDFIVNGAILCCSQKKNKKIKRFFNAPKDRDELKGLRSKVDEMYRSLTLQISLSILENTLKCKPPHVPSVNHAFGIKQQIDEVVKRLQWENDMSSVAVVVHGLGGSGKTTLADAVYDSLRDKLKGWKYSKIILIQNLEDPNVEQLKSLQSLILQDLTGGKENVRDLESGRQSLKEIMEKESIFLYIDNALFLKPLQELLPREITNPKKLRLLLTARNTNISDVMEDCRIKCEIHPIEPLPLDAAIQVLCRKIDRERDTNSLLEERPQVKEIAQKCSSCPLFLEVVGGFLRRRRNEVEAYERVFNWIENGEPFSGDSRYSVEESKVLFAYEQLKPSAQDAFLDICSFFYGWHWDWEEVARIVGEEEMQCLEEGALINRKLERSEEGRRIIKISIHDLLLSVGHTKSKANRFRTPEEFTKALQNDKLLGQIKGVWLTHTRWIYRRASGGSYKDDFRGPIDVPSEVLDAMSGSLRVFAMGKWTFVKGKCSKSFDELRFLQADEVPNLPMDISKLSRLTYMECSLGDTINLCQLKDLSTLKVLNVLNPLDSGISNDISELGYPNKLWKLSLKKFPSRGISNLVNLCDLKKLQLWQCDNLIELPKSIGKLQSLQELYLDGCSRLKQLPVGFGKLKALTVLSLSYCSNLQELPMDFVNLSSLQYLDLRYCTSLQELPSNLEKLTSLQYLNLNGCSELLKLPEQLGNLPSLTEINFNFCKKLSTLPHSLGGVTSLLMSNMSLEGCSNLTELPEETLWLSGMKIISFEYCSSLKKIPNHLSKLTCLETLNLRRCESIEELWNDFHGLEMLRRLFMSQCRSLSTLPQGFGKLRSLQRLNLSNCDKLQNLSGDFHCLGALKELNLSGCCSLNKLPDFFGQLGCLEKVNLSACSNLVKLSDDFDSLPSLIKIKVSNCKKLGGKWMDSVGAIKSLWYVDISGSEGMTQRWMEMQREKDQWHFVVVTESSSKENKSAQSSLIVERIIWKLFSEEGLLIDGFQRPFSSSSLLSNTRLILVIQSCSVDPGMWRSLERNLQRLECNSKAMAIIYVGREFNALQSEVADRIVAYTPLNSWIDSFLRIIDDVFLQFSSLSVFASTIDVVEQNAIKYLSTWEDISYILNEEEILIRNPRESNVELLRKLLVTAETDFLLHNNEQVKVNDLEGKVVLLLRTGVRRWRNKLLEISALEDMYLKLQRSSEYRVELVWIPQLSEGDNPADYERAVTSAPWPMVPKPWLLTNERYGDGLTVVDEKGSMSCKDAMPMILRWGIKAYPFSASREDELRKAEWERLNFSSQSSLEFVLQSLECFQSRGREALLRGEMIFVCVGPIKKMLEFVPELNCALTKLESVVQVFYVGNYGATFDKFEEENEMKRDQMSSITSLSLSDVYRFWERISCLWDELGSVGVEEKTVQVRRMVLGFVRAEEKAKGLRGEEVNEKRKGIISIVGVDEKGEIINGRGEEMVRLLSQSDKEEEHHKLLVNIKSEGFSNVLRKRWADGTIHPKHHPHHPLVRLDHDFHFKGGLVPKVSCDTCFRDIDRGWGVGYIRYRCSVCEKYEMCQKCFEC